VQNIDFGDGGGDLVGEGHEVVRCERETVGGGKVGAPGLTGGWVEVESPFYVEAGEEGAPGCAACSAEGVAVGEFLGGGAEDALFCGGYWRE